MNRHRELLQRAEAFLRADKLPEAHAVCESLLREAPQFAPALHLSALVLYRAGQLPAATERFRAAVIADPTLADGWSNLGIALEAAGQPKAAATALERAVELDANAVQYRCNLAAIRLGLASSPRPKPRRARHCGSTITPLRPGTTSRTR